MKKTLKIALILSCTLSVFAFVLLHISDSIFQSRLLPWVSPLIWAQHIGFSISGRAFPCQKVRIRHRMRVFQSDTYDPYHQRTGICIHLDTNRPFLSCPSQPADIVKIFAWRVRARRFETPIVMLSLPCFNSAELRPEMNQA